MLPREVGCRGLCEWPSRGQEVAHRKSPPGSLSDTETAKPWAHFFSHPSSPALCLMGAHVPTSVFTQAVAWGVRLGGHMARGPVGSGNTRPGHADRAVLAETALPRA